MIIDNMMNLELLFEATALSGDSTFYNIAVKHADTTIAHHFRPDNSCYHVVDYDPETGEVRKRQLRRDMRMNRLGLADKLGTLRIYYLLSLYERQEISRPGTKSI